MYKAEQVTLQALQLLSQHSKEVILGSLQKVQKPLKVGKTDVYSLTLNSEWLEGESLSSYSVSIMEGEESLSKGSTSLIGNTIYVYLTGVAIKDNIVLVFNYSTPTRSDSYSYLIDVVNEVESNNVYVRNI